MIVVECPRIQVLAEGTMPELANQVSGVVLLLLAALRQTYPTGGGSSEEGERGNRDSGDARSVARRSCLSSNTSTGHQSSVIG